MGLTMDSVPSFLSFLVLFPLFLPYSADYNKTNEDACPPCFLCESLPESSATSIECVFRPVCCGDSREPPNTNHSQTEKWGHVEKCSSDHNKDNATSPPPLLGHPVSFKSCRLSNDRENPDFYDRYPKTPTCPRSPSQLVLFTCHNNSNQVNPFRDYSANTVYECHPCDDIRNHLHSPFNGSIIELYYDNGDAFSVWGEERSLQFNWSSEIFDCCPGGVDGCHVPPPIPNPKLDHSIVKGDGSGHWRWILGIGIAAIGIVIITLLIRYCMRKKFLSYWKSEKGDDRSMKAFVKNFGSEIAPRRYSYLEVKKMTTNFKNKLGQGGFGCVYRGKLNNGQCVAVKVLKESKGNGEEFINEVASISQTSHVNIVRLLGFCFEGHKRALVYEFLPNGSLEKFICNKNFSTECKLGGETLYKIAIGIARGLEYLHVGCKTRILHFDIKPHNILLDKDFCPKISDFGLSKLCLNRESNITTLGARGTIGYIAPEIFSRNFGRISYKSDVYSYGIMILEMTSGRSNSNVDISHTSETYFPHWIYKRLKLDEEIGTHGVTNEFENERVRKMIIIGLWCIQIDPSDRPSMTKVIEMLEGSLENLPIPPRPYLSSPAREPIDSSTI